MALSDSSDHLGSIEGVEFADHTKNSGYSDGTYFYACRKSGAWRMASEADSGRICK
jgi:hypothetical protein